MISNHRWSHQMHRSTATIGPVRCAVYECPERRWGWRIDTPDGVRTGWVETPPGVPVEQTRWVAIEAVHAEMRR